MGTDTHLYIEGTPGVHALAQVGGDELRSRVPSDVPSVFSVDIHKKGYTHKYVHIHRGRERDNHTERKIEMV